MTVKRYIYIYICICILPLTVRSEPWQEKLIKTHTHGTKKKLSNHIYYIFVVDHDCMNDAGMRHAIDVLRVNDLDFNY